MADMQISYPQVRQPLDSLREGIMQGVQIGSMMNRGKQEEERPSDAVIADPGPRPQVQLSDMLKEERIDLLRFKDAEKRYKGSGEFGEFNIRTAIANETKSPIVKKAIESGMSSKEIETVMRDISSGEHAETAMSFLKDKFEGDDSLIKAKIGEVQQAQKQLDDIYALKIRNILKGIEEYRDDPRKFQYKGRSNPQTLAVVNNEMNYVEQLVRMGGDNLIYARDYLQKKQSARGGSAGVTSFQGKDKNGETVYWTGTIEAGPARYGKLTNITRVGTPSEMDKVIDRLKPQKKEESKPAGSLAKKYDYETE